MTQMPANGHVKPTRQPHGPSRAVSWTRAWLNSWRGRQGCMSFGGANRPIRHVMRDGLAACCSVLCRLCVARGVTQLALPMHDLPSPDGWSGCCLPHAPARCLRPFPTLHAKTRNLPLKATPGAGLVAVWRPSPLSCMDGWKLTVGQSLFLPQAPWSAYSRRSLDNGREEQRNRPAQSVKSET